MKVYNQDKTEILTEYDLKKGYLQADKLFIKHHKAVKAVKEQGRYETDKEYPNGGKDVKWVVDVPGVEAREAYDEYEDIQVYIPYNEKELERMAAEREICELKAKLRDSDYKAIKYAEGALTDAEYAETKAQRQAWRKRINDLESVIGEVDEWKTTLNTV